MNLSYHFTNFDIKDVHLWFIETSRQSETYNSKEKHSTKRGDPSWRETGCHSAIPRNWRNVPKPAVPVPNKCADVVNHDSGSL